MVDSKRVLQLRYDLHFSFDHRQLYGIDMSNPSLASNHAFNGHVACACMSLFLFSIFIILSSL